MCSLHPSEFFVAFDNEKQQLVCNRCIYENSTLEKDTDLAFTALITQDLKTLIDEKYAEYVSSKGRMHDTLGGSGDKLVQDIQGNINGFFHNLERSLDSLQEEVLTHIVDSNQVQQINHQWQGIQSEVQMQRYEQELGQLEQLIDRKLFSKVTENYQQYEQLLQQIKDSSQ